MGKSTDFTILVAESDPGLLDMTERSLLKAGYKVLIANDGQECLKSLRKTKPDLLILGLNLRDTPGVDLCATVKKDPKLSSTVIFLTGLKIKKEQVAALLEAGAFGYIPRPLTNRDFLALIDGACSVIEAERAVRKLSSRTEAILAAVPDIIMEVDQNKIYTWANKPGYDFFGSDVIGKHADYYFEGEQKTYEIVQPLFNGHEDIFYVESWQRRRDSQKRLLAWWCRVLKDSNGKVSGALSSARDITMIKSNELALLESEEKFRNLFEHSNVGKSITRTDGIINVNSAYCELLGYKKEELLNKKWQDLTHPDDLERDITIMNSIIKGESNSHNWEKRYIHKNGKIVWVDVSTVLERDSDGKPLYFITTFLDISKRKEADIALKDSEARLSAFMKFVPALILIKDHELRPVFANEKFSQIFPIEDWMGKKPHEIFPKEVAEQMMEKDTEALQKGYTAYEESWTDKSGRQRTYFTQKFRIDIPESQPLLGGIISDITEQKLAKEELITAKEKAEQSDRLKSTFLANMSHEIRTPMNAIVGFAGMLTDPYLSCEERDKFSNIIQSRSNDLMHIINDLLEISRIESGNATVIKGKFVINNLLNELELIYSQRLQRTKKSNLSLKVDKPLSDKQSAIISDGYIIKEVFSNLIDNAIKYTPSGFIRFGYHPPENDTITCFVTDTGIGISPKDQELIFEHFRQAEREDPHKYGGTGLGLSICKGSLSLIGGHIRVDSSPGNGSTFYFTFPYEPDISSKMENGINPDPPVSKGPYFWPGKKVLLVEDEDSNIEFLNILLRRTNAEMICVRTGKELRSEYKNLIQYHLVLLDIRLPDADGWELAKEIKAIRPDLTVIAQTAYAMATDRQKSEIAGCNDYISKPINKDQLMKMLSRYLEQSS